MKQKYLSKTVFASALLALATQAFGVDIVPMNSGYYYQLGGGSDISAPPVTDQQDITLGGDINTGLGYTCTGFNPAVSISNTINNIKDSVQGLEQSVIGSASSAVGSMPMYLLSKSNKDLYNLLQNTMTDAEDKFHVSMKSCQDALSQIKSGKSPYQDWFSVSDSQGWFNYAKQAKQGQSVDINDASKQIAKDPQKYGIPWVHKGQNSGGTNGDQVPIHVIYDVVVAGYNATVDPSLPLDAAGTSAPNTSGLSRYWKTAQAAGNWARLVLGDITISSRDGQDQTTRGTGLMTLVQTCPQYASNNLTCATTLSQQLTDIVSSNATPTAEQLKAVSSNETMVTPSLILGMRNLSQVDRALTISKLSQDIALQNIVDEALLMRQVLIAGSQTRPVHNLQPALTMVNTALNQLDKDIQNILFQFKVRKTLMLNTAGDVMNHQAGKEASAVAQDNQTQESQLVNGAVYKSQQE